VSDSYPKPESPAKGASSDSPPLPVSGQETVLALPNTVTLAGARRADHAGLPSVPGYEILSVLGRGGMGVVYKARHLSLKRTVALKMILAGGHAGESERARFRAEAEAVARLQHPGIVQIHEVGEYAGHPFCALEFVEGGSLAQRLNGQALPARVAARLVQALAQAIHLAHSRNVVHRDLKPANILLAAGNGELSVAGNQGASSPPSTEAWLLTAVPKITDFGLARQLDSDSGQTQSGAVMGTPSYMAPEQAAGRTHEAGPAADVYALGAILYECLTGQPPFKGESLLETLEQVRTKEPAPPSRLQLKLPRDLETICLKCLRKEPEKRYSSGAELADELGRFLNGEPILARPVGRGEQLIKWARRKPAVAALGASVVFLVLAGSTAAAVLAGWALREKDRADERARTAQIAEERATERAGAAARAEGVAAREAKAAIKAEQNAQQARADADRDAKAARQREYNASMLLAQTAWEQNHVDQCLDLLESQEPRAGHDDLRAFEWHYWKNQFRRGNVTLKGHTDCVNSVCYSPDGMRLASGSQDRTLKMWDAASGEETLTLKGHTGGITGVCFSPDGKRLASGSQDGTVKVWDVASGQEAFTLEGHAGGITGVCFSPDGKRLASSAEDRTVRVWDLSRRPAGDQIDLNPPVLTLRAHTREVLSVCFSRDGKRLASASKDGTVKVWDVASGNEPLTFKGHTTWVTSIAFSPDGKRIASTSLDRTAKVWDAMTGEVFLTFKGHERAPCSICFSPDGTRLASAAQDQTVKVWDSASGEEILNLKGHTKQVSSVCFSSDGKHVASGSWDETVKVWDTTTGQETLTVSREILALKGRRPWIMSVCYSPDGRRLATASADPIVNVWDAMTAQKLLTLKGHTGTVSSVCYSPDGKRLASASWDLTVKVWDAVTGRESHTLKGHTELVHSVCFSPDGTRLASAAWDRTVKVWDAGTGHELLTLEGHTAPVESVCFSPDGKLLASASQDQTLKVWELGKWQAGDAPPPARTLKGHTSMLTSVCFSPDGRRLASGSWDLTRSVKVWDVTTGQEALTLKGYMTPVYGVCFSPDGKRLASASNDMTVKVWDAVTGQQALTLKGHTNIVVSVCFSPDGKRLASSSHDGSVKVWDADSGEWPPQAKVAPNQ